MNEANADKLSMLLSTNWFFDHWPTIGVMADDSQRISIQLACRNIVKKIMSEAKVYWNASFSSDRRAKTEADLVACFVVSGADKSIAEHVKAVLSNESMGSYDSASSSMLAVMTDQLVNSSKTDEVFDMDAKLKNAIQVLWQSGGRNDIDFERLCLKSADPWDIYIRSLTPDLPMMLADYLSELLDAIDDRFLSMWARIVKTMPEQDVSRIRSSYLEAARKAIDPEFVLPAWMINS